MLASTRAWERGRGTKGEQRSWNAVESRGDAGTQARCLRWVGGMMVGNQCMLRHVRKVVAMKTACEVVNRNCSLKASILQVCNSAAKRILNFQGTQDEPGYRRPCHKAPPLHMIQHYEHAFRPHQDQPDNLDPANLCPACTTISTHHAIALHPVHVQIP